MEFESEPIKETPPDNRSLDEKVVDKNWKTRVAAYEQLENQLKAVLGEDPIFEQYGSLLPKMVSDSNASALDAGLGVAIQFVEQFPEGSVCAFTQQYGEKIAASVIDKALSGRTTVQVKGKALLLKLMEVDDPTMCSTVLLGKLLDKKPKIPPLCLEILKEGINLFGAKSFPIREIIARMGDVMNKGTSDSRASATSLMLELTKWIGVAPFAAMLETIKPVQKTEFEALYAARDIEEGKPKPSLYLRKERAAAKLAEVSSDSSEPSSKCAGGGGNAKKAVAEEDEDEDAREYAEEVDLVKVLKATEHSKLVTEEKWSEQLKGLQIVIDAIGPTPKIKPGSDVYDLVSVCKGFLRAGHLSVQQASLKILALLADGLRGDFTNTLRPVLQAVVSKCKEKRLLSEVKVVLMKSVLHCVSFDVLSDDVAELVKNKKTPPHARLCLLESASDMMERCPEKIGNDALKALADMLISSCEDSDPKVREMCVRTLVVLSAAVKTRGRGAVEAHKMIMKLEQSTPKVFKRMESFKEGGEASASSSTSSRPRISKVASSSAVAPKRAAPPNSLVKSKSVSAGKSSTSNFSNKMKAASSSSQSAAENDDNVEEVIMSVEDAIERLTEMNIPGWSNIQTLVVSDKWQDRVEALETIEKYVEENEAGAVMCIPMTSFLKSHFPKLKSTNMTIMKSLMQLYSTCANRTGSASFSKSVALELIQAWGDKFCDKKGKDAFGALLTVIAGAVSPGFCFKQMKRIMDKTKAPLGHQFFLEWLRSTINEFGAVALPVQLIATFCHVELENKVAGVRTASVEVMGELFHQLGPKFSSMALTDALKPALKTTLEAQFDKVGYDASQQPTRAVKGQANDQKAAAGFSIPRTDLSTALDRSVISNLTTTEGKNSWQVRKTAMEAVIEACERSDHFIEGNAAAKEVLKGLKARLSDTQANLKPMGALALGHVLSSLDAEMCHKFLKPLATSLLSGIADNKKSMRDAVVSALQRIVTLSKEGDVADSHLIGTLLSSAVEAIVNPVGREELLSFFMLHVQSDAIIKTDCSELAPSLVVALQDKVASTRVLTEQLMTALVGKGYLTSLVVERSFRSLPPATLRSLQAPKERILAAGEGHSGGGGGSNLSSIEESEEPVRKLTRPSSKTMTKSASVSSKVSSAAPTATAVSAPPSVENDSSSGSNAYFPLKKTNKAKRLEDYYKSNWPQPPEDPAEHERTALRAVWEPLIDKALFDILFPEKISGLANQDSVMDAVAELLSLLNDEPTGATSGCTFGPKCSEMVIQHTDLMLKWVALALCMRESSNGLLKLLLLVATIFNKIKNVPNLQLHEGEVVCILPALIDKSGHKSERHKFGFKHAINACTPIISSNRLCQVLLNGLTCKNKKTRVVCIEEIDRIVEVSGPSSLGKVGIREISSTLNNKDTDVGVRNAALDFCFTLYITIGSDRKKLMKILGDISERAIPMIDHRIKEKMKTQSKESDDGKASREDSEREQAVASSTSASASSSRPTPAAAAKQERVEVREVSTPVLKVASFDLEDDDVAFRLEMTPPEADTEESDPSAHSRYTATASSDALALRMDMDSVESLPHPPLSVSVPTSVSVEDSLAELDDVYVDIVSKVDDMLRSGASTEESAVAECVQNAKDHLKMLHTIITTQNNTQEPGNQAYGILQRHAPALVDRLNLCINYGFEHMSPCAAQETESTGLSGLVDVGLISVSLACMFALLDCCDLLRYLNESRVTEMLSTGIKWLVDPRFFPSEGSSLAPKTEQDLSKALNAFLIKIGSSRPFKNGVVICSVIEVLSLCIEEKKLDNALSPACAKPLSRLLLKVLSNEASRGSTKAFHLPNVDTMRLMSVLHSFFNSHPSTVPSNDVPYCCAKTVFAQLIEALGSSEIDRLSQVLKIPETAFIYRLSKRLSTQGDEVSGRGGSVPAPPVLVPAIVEAVDSITSARDKVGAIRQLQGLLRLHPGVHVGDYLQHASSTFQSFVRDTLVKLDGEADKGSGARATHSPPTKKEDGETDGTEALRILEGLKSNSKRSILTSPLNENIDRSSASSSSLSSRALIQDKIKGTLNSISASLSTENSSAQVSSSSVSGGFGADSDLAARLARLKRIESMSSSTS